MTFGNSPIIQIFLGLVKNCLAKNKQKALGVSLYVLARKTHTGFRAQPF